MYCKNFVFMYNTQVFVDPRQILYLPDSAYFTCSAGRCVSLDCEMVGTGRTGDFSMLARCSVVNHHGNVLYDSFVAPMDKITDYRTKFSGITPQLLLDGIYEFG